MYEGSKVLVGVGTLLTKTKVAYIHSTTSLTLKKFEREEWCPHSNQTFKLDVYKSLIIKIIKINRLFSHKGHIHTYIHTYFKSLRFNRKLHQHLEMLFIRHYTLSAKINQGKYYKCWQKHNTWSNINNETVNLGHIWKTSVHYAVHNQFAKL